MLINYKKKKKCINHKFGQFIKNTINLGKIYYDIVDVFKILIETYQILYLTDKKIFIKKLSAVFNAQYTYIATYINNCISKIFKYEILLIKNNIYI